MPQTLPQLDLTQSISSNPAETSQTSTQTSTQTLPSLDMSQSISSEPAAPAAPGLLQRAESAVVGPGTFLGTSVPGDTWTDLFHDPAKFVKSIPGAVKTLGEAPLLNVDNLFTPEEREAHPIATGVAEFAGGLTSPEGIAVNTVTGGLGSLPGAAGKIIPRLVSAGFSGQMLHSAFKEIPQFRAAMADGDATTAERIMTHMTLEVAAAALGSQHAFTGEAKPMFPGMDEAVKDYAAKGMNAIGAIPGGIKEAAGEAAGDTAAAVKKVVKGPTPTPEDVVGKITQATGADRAKAARALSSVDTSDVKTFGDLRNVFDDQVKANTAKVDTALGKSTTKYLPEALDREVPVKGGEPIKSNPVTDALDQMETFYDKVGAVDDLARIKSLQNQYKTQGLTPMEINSIAREHGTNLSGFNANGELSSGLSKQNAENTRTGVKDIVHGLLPDENTRAIDRNTSDLISARDMADDMKDKVEKLQNKLQKAGVLQKLGHGVGKAIDLSTGGLVSGILKQIVGTASKTGENQLTPIDIERNLPKNLKLLDDLNAMPPEAAAKKVQTILQENQSVNSKTETSNKTSSGQGSLLAAGGAAVLGGAIAATGAKAQEKQPDTSYDVGPETGKPIPGLVQKGNIDVNHRPEIRNADGSVSSIYSTTIALDKNGKPWRGNYENAPQYALVPQIADGKFLTPDGKKPNEKDKKAMAALEDAAEEHYVKTHEHLGIFKTGKDADNYASATHAWLNDGTDRKVYAPSYTEKK